MRPTSRVVVEEVALRAVSFSRAVEKFLETGIGEDSKDGLWARNLLDELVNFEELTEVIDQELYGYKALGPGKTLVVTPSTGYTTGIMGLMWPWLLGGSVSVAVSSRDEWTSKFIADSKLPGLEIVSSFRGLENAVLWTRLSEFDSLIVYGSDLTCRQFKTDWQMSGNHFGRAVFYGSKFSVAVHDSEGWEEGDTEAYFDDITIFDGLGCLNTSVLYVNALTPQIMMGLEDLAKKLEAVADPLAIAHMVLDSAMGGVFVKQLGPIIIRKAATEEFVHSLGKGTLFVVDLEGKPWEMWRELTLVPGQLSSATIMARDSQTHDGVFKLLASVGVTRFTIPGAAQQPKISWAHDGMSSVIPLVDLLTVEDF